MNISISLTETQIIITELMKTTVTPETYQCMEVWGGNQSTFSAFEKAGLDIWLYNTPCGSQSSGGDIYYISSCASGRLTRLLLADVSGHGESVEAVATNLRDLMRRFINSIQPNELFRQINHSFALSSDQEIFATAILASYFIPTGTLTICNAGHPPPLIYRKREQQWSYLEGTESEHLSDLPLGVLNESSYTQFNVKLSTGDLILCYTDGLIEAENPSKKMLSASGLLKVIEEEIHKTTADQLIPTLLNRLTASEQFDLSQDDLTLMLFQGNRRGISLKDNLLALYRFFKGATIRPMKSK